MNKTIDNTTILKSVDNQSVVGNQDIDLNSLITNTIISKDDDLTLARFDDPMVCFRIAQQRAEINCQLDFKEMGATEYWTTNVSGDDLQITSSQQVAGLPTMSFTQIPGGTTTATSISNPLRTDTVNPGTWNWTRNANSMVVSHVEFNPANEVLRRTFQYGFKGDETDGTYVINTNEHDASGDKIGEYMRTEYTRAKEFRILSDVTNLIANFNLTGSSIVSPLQYTGSTPTNGYFLQTDASGNATWQPVSGETNTASNVGAGAGVFKQKTGLDLELRSVIGGVGLTQTQNVDDITIDLDNTAVTASSYGSASQSPTFTVDQQGRLTAATNVNIDHDALDNFVAAEHIDWTTSSANNLITTGKVTTGTFQLTTGPTDGAHLISDASGNASWQGARTADVYWENNASTTSLTPADTFIKVVATGTTLNPGAMGGWDLNGVQNRLRYTGTRGGIAHAGCTLSLDGSNGKIFQAAIYKNGTTRIPGSLVEFSTANATSQTSTAIHFITPVVTNDYFELWLSCVGSTDTPTILHANIFAIIMG